MDQNLLLQARKLLQDITPMNGDCGKYCGAACCQPDENGQNGVYLFPGEESIVLSCPGNVRILPVGPGDRNALFCVGACERQCRPLACMIFPLTPEIDGEGHIVMRFDARARPLCPLLRNGLMGLRRDFRSAALQAMNMIAADPDGLSYLRQWQALEEQYIFRL